MKELVLCKYGEISLKGANRSHFEKLLRDLLKKRTAPYGSFRIYSMQSTVYIEPENEEFLAIAEPVVAEYAAANWKPGLMEEILSL